MTLSRFPVNREESCCLFGCFSFSTLNTQNEVEGKHWTICSQVSQCFFLSASELSKEPDNNERTVQKEHTNRRIIFRKKNRRNLEPKSKYSYLLDIHNAVVQQSLQFLFNGRCSFIVMQICWGGQEFHDVKNNFFVQISCFVNWSLPASVIPRH